MDAKELHKEELCYSIAKVIDCYGRGWNTKQGSMFVLADELDYFIDNASLSEQHVKTLTEKFKDFISFLDNICNEIK